jgi:hypothetical protein
MNTPKCSTCNDTGSISKDMAGNLDCTSCDAASERTEMGDFLNTLPVMRHYEAAWLIHQRALAMAPKKETAPCSECGGSGFTYWGEGTPGNGFDVAPEPPEQECCQSCSGSGNAPKQEELEHDPDDSVLVCASDLQHSAIFDNHEEARDCMNAIATRLKALAVPAAANGALTDEQIKSICESTGWIPEWNDRDHIKFARAILAAACPDAALVKAAQAMKDEQDSVCVTDAIKAITEMADDEEVLVSAKLLLQLFVALSKTGARGAA